MSSRPQSTKTGTSREGLFQSNDLVLVTGGSGFVASHLVDRLVERGYRLRLLVRTTSRLQWIERHLRTGQIELAYGDVSDKATCAGACVGVRGVFHFAALVRARTAREYFAANAQGTRNLAEARAERGLPGGFFVYCSSMAAGGPGFAIEQDPEPVRTESDPSVPITAYGQSKLDGELALRDVAEAHGLYRHVILRAPVIYGPRDDGVLLLFKALKFGILPLPSPPSARFSMMHVQDLVDAAVTSAEGSVRGTYYLNDGEVHTWPEVGEKAGALMDVQPRAIRIPRALTYVMALGAEGLGWVTGRAPVLSRSKARDLQQAHWVVSSEKARRTWGFDPMISIEQGLEDTLLWYRQNQWL